MSELSERQRNLNALFRRAANGDKLAYRQLNELAKRPVYLDTPAEWRPRWFQCRAIFLHLMWLALVLLLVTQ